MFSHFFKLQFLLYSIFWKYLDIIENLSFLSHDNFQNITSFRDTNIWCNQSNHGKKDDKDNTKVATDCFKQLKQPVLQLASSQVDTPKERLLQ